MYMTDSRLTATAKRSTTAATAVSDRDDATRKPSKLPRCVTELGGAVNGTPAAREVDHTIQEACAGEVAHVSGPTFAAASELAARARGAASRCREGTAQNVWRDGEGDRDFNQLRSLLSMARLPFNGSTRTFGSSDHDDVSDPPSSARKNSVPGYNTPTPLNDVAKQIKKASAGSSSACNALSAVAGPHTSAGTKSVREKDKTPISIKDLAARQFMMKVSPAVSARAAFPEIKRSQKSQPGDRSTSERLDVAARNRALLNSLMVRSTRVGFVDCTLCHASVKLGDITNALIHLLGLQCQSKRIDRVLRERYQGTAMSLSQVCQTSEGKQRVCAAYEMVVRRHMVCVGGGWECLNCNSWKTKKGGDSVSQLAIQLRHVASCIGGSVVLQELETLLLAVVTDS
jgi:hypothetical protein